MTASASFPLGPGQYSAGELTTHEQVTSLFSNFTWTNTNLTAHENEILKHWQTSHTGVYVNLMCFCLYTVSFLFVFVHKNRIVFTFCLMKF